MAASSPSRHATSAAAGRRDAGGDEEAGGDQPDGAPDAPASGGLGRGL